MIISQSKGFIFIHIHKCAGTSIEEALASHLSYNDILLGSTPSGERFNANWSKLLVSRSGGIIKKHSTAREIKDFLWTHAWGGYFKFTVVRHPVSRLLSFYNFLCEVLKPYHDLTDLSGEEKNDLRSHNLLPDRTPFTEKSIFQWPGIKALLLSPCFDGVLEEKSFWKDPATRPQAESVTDKQGKIILDFIGKIEELGSFKSNIESRLDIQLNLKHLNKSHPTRKLDLSRDIIRLIEKKYESDYEMFSY